MLDDAGLISCLIITHIEKPMTTLNTTSNRSNYHLSSRPQHLTTTSPPKIHIFDKDDGTTLMKDLSIALQQQHISHQFHNDSTQFNSLMT